MNPSPAEKPSLVDDLQQVSRRTRRDEVRELCRQAAAELAAAHAEVEKWKANHADMVNRNRLLRDRLDLPAGEVHPRLAILDELSRLAGELARATDLLRQARVFVYDDTLMCADLTRFAPLDPESQAKHDSTESLSEQLLPKIDAFLPPTPPAKEQP